MDRSEIYEKYTDVIRKEFELQSLINPEASLFVHRAEEIYGICLQIIETAKLSLVPRSYLRKYHLAEEDVVFESVGAHTNLMRELVYLALLYEYGPDFGEVNSSFPETIDGYTPMIIEKAVAVHDLPESETGDLSDDGSRNEAIKRTREMEYLGRYFKLLPSWAAPFSERVKKLLLEMEEKTMPTGRLLYAADKAAAVLQVLVCDKEGYYPMIHFDDLTVSERDRDEMLKCDPHGDFGDWHKASEMWTVDFFSIRKLCQYDDTGFFTAVIVMTTLIVNGCWYDWREEEYLG